MPQNRLDGLIVHAELVERGRKPSPESVPAMPFYASSFQRRNNLAPHQVVQIERLSIPRLEDRQAVFCEFAHSLAVIVKCIGQFLHYGDRGLAAVGLRFVNFAVPDGAIDAQFLAAKIFPPQTANFALA